ncbi:MAG TPA: proline iminopeptidase-family hydrolase [Thermodesulfobacteriota bacterium]|nr:proline iminopeptidase-family hydrolase [Thermodesulfobacteriota bacterium]
MVDPTREGYVAVPGGQVWYKIVGVGHSIPVLTLHGGPGAGHDYLEPFDALASERPIVFFDQLGCGKSDKPDDVSLWRIERFVKEVSAVRKKLDLERIHLLGHSWGGWLAIEYLMGKPSGIVSLILASTSASVQQVAEETARLKATLPQAVLNTLQRYEAVGDYHSPEYENVMMEFYKRFLCRLDPWPESLMRSLNNIMSNLVPYETMQGPNEFTFTGNLRDWDRTGRLKEIALPTLIMCGRHDELGPACAETLHRGIPSSEIRIFEQSAHMAHLEEKELYLQVVRGFLGRVERKLGA